MWKIGEAGTSIAMTMVMEAVCLRMAAATALSVMAMVAFQANFRGGVLPFPDASLSSRKNKL